MRGKELIERPRYFAEALRLLRLLRLGAPDKPVSFFAFMGRIRPIDWLRMISKRRRGDEPWVLWTRTRRRRRAS